MQRKRVIIIGGGFGGLNAAKALKNASVDITLIDKTNHHLFQPLLYQVATAALAPRDIAVPIREILKAQKNIHVRLNEVIHIDKVGKKLTLETGEFLEFDYLIVAPGGRHSYFGNPQWEEHAHGLKTLEDAVRIRERVLLAFEHAETAPDRYSSQKYLNFVIVGGGPTGVEMAGAIAEIAHKTMLQNFRNIDPEKTQVFLIEAGPTILPSYPPSLSQKAKEDLEKLGVKVLTDTRVTNVEKESVTLGEQTIATLNIIWAAGNEAAPLLASLDSELDSQKRVIVKEDLSLSGFPNLFVIGDAAHLKGVDTRPLPGISPVAIQEARYVAKIIKSELPIEERVPFRYYDKGSMATIGKARAIAVLGNWKLSGFLAWLTWCFVHILYLIGFRNRFFVMLEWGYWYLTQQRGSRLIYHSTDEKDLKN